MKRCQLHHDCCHISEWDASNQRNNSTQRCLFDFNKRRALLHTLTHSSLCILKLSQHTHETCSCGNSRCQREFCIHLRHTFCPAIMSFMCLKVCAANEVLTKTKRVCCDGVHNLSRFQECAQIFISIRNEWNLRETRNMPSFGKMGLTVPNSCF